MKENDEQRCDPCEKEFEQQVQQIVDRVDDYTREDHEQKRREVDAAFESNETETKE